ncbi:MAG TPA: TadE/TadG family type IV pilus assembly protein [Candidatus Brocadiia bacterium]|nr:pilus assembly protein [Planctomycetota bacterium]MDO8092327.1 TadE/TadG family type IV pilus assembly protein [Candidatus Brocadiales bacterium]
MNPFKRFCRYVNRRNGSATVEFALILPLFALMLYGMTEFGRAWFTMHVITNATREGARKAIIQGSTSTDVQNTINNYLSASGLNTAYASITARVNDTIIDVSTANTNDTISVTVNYNFQVLTGSIIPTLTSLPIMGGRSVAWSGTIPLSNTAVMRHE